MKRTAAIGILLAGLSGCMSSGSDQGRMPGHSGMAYQSSIPGVQGPMGQPLPMMAAARTPQSSGGAQLAQSMMMPPGMMAPGMMPPGGMPPSAMSGGAMAGATPPGGSGIMQAGTSQRPGSPSGVVRAGGGCLEESDAPGGGITPAGCCSARRSPTPWLPSAQSRARAARSSPLAAAKSALSARPA